jgi:hypothetical protein
MQKLKYLSWAKVLVFVGILILHWIAQFLAEAYADAVPPRSAAMGTLDRILAVPLVSIGGPLTFRYYWAVTTLNSVLWATVLTYLITRYAFRTAPALPR